MVRRSVAYLSSNAYGDGLPDRVSAGERDVHGLLTTPCCQTGDGVGRPEPVVRAAFSQAACRKNSTLTASKGNSTSPAGVRLNTPASSSAVTSP